MARFCPLFSGSSGNCLYVGSATAGLLVDAGVSARRIERALWEREIDPGSIRAVLITHEHTDHIGGLRVFCKKFRIPVYATPGTCAALRDSNALEPTTMCFPITDTMQIGEFTVTPFCTSHDCRESCGYRIVLPDDRCVGVATDLGVMTQTVRDHLWGCDLIHIESNHDIRMLENGPYPYPLKRRILSAVGHLSNEACARELPALVRSGTTRIVLGHISRENNLPDLAYATARAELAACGLTENIDYVLQTAAPECDRPYTVF
ncbi:MAG: MBL fold metallo-hydrolase [Clostridia bacterium]|nr:MBL fold metallo-hydrolase [Clostridia bacterium]